MQYSLIKKYSLFLLFETIVLSPYISSWFPKLLGLPLGPALRGVAVLLFYSVFFTSIFSGRLLVKINRGLFFILIVFFLLILISIFNGVSNLLQVIIGLHAFIFYPFMFLVLYLSLKDCNLYDRNRFISSTCSLIYFNLLVMAAIAIVDVVSDGEFTLLLGYDPHYGGVGFSLINRYYETVRANGGFADALAFGYLMAVGIAFGLYMMKRIGGQRSKKKYTLLVIVCGAALLMSITRGAILAGSIVILLFVMRKIKNTIILFLVLIVFLPFVSGKYIEIFAGRFSDTDAGSKQSTVLRYEMASDSLEYLYANPFGIGIGTQGGGNVLSDKDNRINTDNFIFHALLELGVIGGLVFYIIIFYQFSIVYRNSGFTPFLCMSVIFFICILVSSSMQSGVLSVTFWLVMSIFTLDAKRGGNVRVI